MVGLDAILRAMHVPLQFRIAQVAQRVDAADELVELEDCAPCRIRRGVGAQLADQRALDHFLQAQCGDDLVDVGLLTDDELPVDLADRMDQALLVQYRIIGAVQLLELVFQIGEARFEAQPEPVQDGEVGLVDAVHVAGDRGRHDVGRVAIPDVEHVVTFVLMRADQVAVERHVVAQQRVGDHALATPEVFVRVARLHGRPLDAELLTIDGTIQRIQIERVMREDRQRGDGVADAVVGRLQRCLAQVLLVGRLQHVVWDVAGARHGLIAVVHGLRDDDGHQAVCVGHFLRIARLQWRER